MTEPMRALSVRHPHAFCIVQGLQADREPHASRCHPNIAGVPSRCTPVSQPTWRRDCRPRRRWTLSSPPGRPRSGYHSRRGHRRGPVRESHRWLLDGDSCGLLACTDWSEMEHGVHHWP